MSNKSKYRIIEETKSNGDKRWYIEKKGFFGWSYIERNYGDVGWSRLVFRQIREAREEIEKREKPPIVVVERKIVT